MSSDLSRERKIFPSDIGWEGGLTDSELCAFHFEQLRVLMVFLQNMISIMLVLKTNKGTPNEVGGLKLQCIIRFIVFGYVDLGLIEEGYLFWRGIKSIIDSS